MHGRLPDKPLSTHDRVLLLGRPGAGKGLVGRLLALQLGAEFFSMGDLLRAERRRESEHSRLIGELIEAGNGVPPELSYSLMSSVLNSRVGDGPLILDGVPRRADEIERVRELLGGEPTAVVVLEVPTPIAVHRLESRRTCEACGWPHGPGWEAQDGCCTSCGGQLAARRDDFPAGIARRHEVWRSEEQEIIRYYERLDVARTIPADAPALRVLERVIDAFGDRSA